MVLWFVATAILAAWYVFRDPAFDYRLLIVGSVLPSVFDMVGGGARVVHSLAFSVVLLGLVMAVTVGRRALRRRLLGLPLGTMMHLVFSAAWADTKVFWWPFSGADLRVTSSILIGRGWVNLVLEIVGLGLLWWIHRAAQLSKTANRAAFRSTGRLSFGVSQLDQP